MSCNPLFALLYIVNYKMKHHKVLLLVNVIYIYAMQGARGEKGDEGTPVSMISSAYFCSISKIYLFVLKKNLFC